MVAVQRAAVPAMVPELVLALSDPLLGALADGLHDVWVALAQMPLLVHQARDVVADHAGPQGADIPDRGGGGEGLKETNLKKTTRIVANARTLGGGERAQRAAVFPESEFTTLNSLGLGRWRGVESIYSTLQINKHLTSPHKTYVCTCG